VQGVITQGHGIGARGDRQHVGEQPDRRAAGTAMLGLTVNSARPLRRVHASGLPFGCWCGKVVMTNRRGAKVLSPTRGRSCMISAALETSFRCARFGKLSLRGLKSSVIL
jgi:hypothetical protein